MAQQGEISGRGDQTPSAGINHLPVPIDRLPKVLAETEDF
jgi:hypothetical protein